MMMTLRATQQRKSSPTTGRVKPRVVGSHKDEKAKLLAKQLGTFIRVMRDSRGISRSTLSLVTGISEGTIDRWERLGAYIVLPHLVLVSRYFFMSPWDFMRQAVQHWKDNDYAP